MKILLNTKPLHSADRTGVGYYASNLYRELLKSAVDAKRRYGKRCEDTPPPL